MLFYILQDNYHIKSCIFFEDLLPCNISGAYIKLCFHFTNAECRHVSIFDIRKLISTSVGWCLVTWCSYQVSWKSSHWFKRRTHRHDETISLSCL